jgi:hypothetical protein
METRNDETKPTNPHGCTGVGENEATHAQVDWRANPPPQPSPFGGGGGLTGTNPADVATTRGCWLRSAIQTLGLGELCVLRGSFRGGQSRVYRKRETGDAGGRLVTKPESGARGVANPHSP